MPKRRPSAATYVALLLTLAIGTQTTVASSATDSKAPQRIRLVDVMDADLTSVSVGWTRSRDNVGVVGYGVYLDGSRRATTPSTSFTLQELACGKGYLFAVDAFDAAGNRSSRTSAAVSTHPCRDVAPPSAPVGVQQLATTETSAVFGWLASSDDVGVVEYGLYVGGLRVGTVYEPAATVSNLRCGTTYSLGIDAADAAGNRSARTERIFSTPACVDRSAPSAPANLAISGATQTEITLTWSASSDNVAVTSYGLYRAGARIGSSTATTTRFGGLVCGTTYSLGVDAVDAAGNRSATSGLTAATAPCPPSSGGGDAAAPSAPSNLHVASATQTEIVIRWDSATDNVGVVNYRIYRNGTKIGEGPGVHGGYTNQWTDRGRACGTTYQYSVEALDAVGNVGPRANLGATTTACSAPDATPPSTPTGLAASTRTATSIALTWSPSTDNIAVAGYGLYRDGTQVALTTGTTGIATGLTCGRNYTLAVDAYDAAGNRSPQAVVMVSTTACADTQPPSTPSGLAVSNVTQTGLALNWSPSTDNVAVTGYDVYRNSSKVGYAEAPSASQSDLACGTAYTLAVVARDAAGNASGQAQTVASTSPCSTASSSNVVEFSGTISPAQFAAAVAAKPAGPLTVRPSAGSSSFSVSGDLEISRPLLAIERMQISGGVEFGPGSSGSSLKQSTAMGFYIKGADDIVLDGNTFDGGGVVKDTQIWDEPAGNAPDRWQITNNTFRNYYVASDPSKHSQAIFVGYSTSGVIRGNTFTNNGNTAHVFFSWFGNLADPAVSWPRSICVAGNTFNETHGAYIDINFRAEIPTDAGIVIQRDASTDAPHFYGDC